MEEIVKRISKILEEQQLSSSAFADTIGVQRSSISHVLSGRNKPSLEFILKIIRSFPSYSTDWLLFGKQTDAAKAYQQPAENTAKNQVEDLDFTSESYEIPEKPTEFQTVSKSESEIDKVILLLKDGSFTDYISKND
jgi:plasmid maintenance system antidote protein VapI|tara:strand:+ start:1589 stop:1999 length:411 start_codon:yes stop_codon:yes gene_type:complete